MAIEQVQRVYCAVNEGKGEPVSGSYTEEIWEGSWAEMCAYADQKTAAEEAASSTGQYSVAGALRLRNTGL